MSSQKIQGFASGSALVADCDGSPAGYLRVARLLEAAEAEPGPVRRVTWVASFTTELLAPYLVVEGARLGMLLQPSFAPFGQIEQPILDANSALYRSNPDVVVIAFRIEDSLPALTDGWVGLSAADAARLVDGHVARIRNALLEVRLRSGVRMLVWNQAPLEHLAAGLADPVLEATQADMIANLNRAIARAVCEVADTYVFDMHSLVTELGVRACYDAKLAHLTRMPWSAKAQAVIAAKTARYVRAMWRPPCKCLVLDLDNTLWGGVIGEDGLGGIKLGQDYPGSAFVAFQRRVLSYRDRGVLLAVASKNNEPDALEVFERHPNMVIKVDDLAAREIHWNDKASSLRAIADRLNIGTDSLAFFDDNPVERDFIRAQLPEVTVIEVPRSPLGYGDALDASGAFDMLTITREDRGRTTLYRNDNARQRLAEAAGSVEDFLRALEMRVTIGPVNDETLPRVVQLLGKTNQFNVTTRRHGQADLQHMIAGGAIALRMRIEDRFGDNGLVGVAIAVPGDDGSFLVDTFLMSCRVLGRRAENALLDSLARRVHAHGARTLYGEFLPTSKNAPAARFFSDSGFSPVEGAPGRFRLALPTPPDPAAALFDLVEES